jgi:hypothetical protein
MAITRWSLRIVILVALIMRPENLNRFGVNPTCERNQGERKQGMEIVFKNDYIRGL